MTENEKINAHESYNFGYNSGYAQAKSEYKEIVFNVLDRIIKGYECAEQYEKLVGVRYIHFLMVEAFK